jgi:hypothetical protein
MDHIGPEADDPEKFPPKTIWCWWDSQGEFMDCSDELEDAERWKGTGFLARYSLTQIEFDCRTEPLPTLPDWAKPK